MKKILVTGGAGFIGGYLVNKLIKKNYDVMVVDHLKTIGGGDTLYPSKMFFCKRGYIDARNISKD